MDHTTTRGSAAAGRSRHAAGRGPGARRERHEAHAYEVPRVKTGAIHREGQEPLGDDLDRAYYSDAPRREPASVVAAMACRWGRRGTSTPS